MDSQSSILKTSSSRVKSRSASATSKPAKSNALSPVSHATAVTRKPSSKSVSPEHLSSSQSTSSEHRCVYCDDPSVQIKRVTRSFGKAAALLVIEAIPMWSCPGCGASYFSAQTLHEIERIKALRKSVSVRRPIPVAAFQLATI